MADIGALIIKIGADASELKKAFDDLGGSAKQFERGIERMAKVSFAALAVVNTAIVAMTISAGKQAEELQQLSAVTGINTDKLQEYDAAMSRVGLSGGDLTVVMRTLSKNMEDAKNGTGNAADRFRQLGLDITKVTNTDDLIRKIADSVSRFANGTEKAAIVSDLLGKSGLKFIPLFEGGAKAIDAAAAAAANLGRQLSAIEIERLARMDDELDDMATAWKRFSQQVGVAFEPAVTMVIRLFKDLLVQGTETFHKLQLAADLFAIDLLHLALAAEEAGSVLFTDKTVKQALANIKLIFAEASKLKALAREKFAIDVPAADDTRGKPPPLVDTAKLAAQAQALADAQQKFNESLFKNEQSLAQARLANYESLLEAQKTAGISTEEEIAVARQAAIERMDAFETESLERQIRNYAKFYQAKVALFTADEKGQADKAKFELESNQQLIALLNQLEIAQIKSDTNRMKSASAVAEATKKQILVPLQDELTLAKADFELQQAFYSQAPSMIGAANAAREKGFALLQAEADLRAQEINNTIADEERKTKLIIALDGEMQAKRMQMIEQFPTFYEQQLQSLIQSNTFSMGAIVNTWTSGIATMIRKGGDLKAAWESTQQALLQAGLNSLVTWAAESALTYSRDLALYLLNQKAKTAGLSAAQTTQLAAHKGFEAAKTGLTAAGEAARLAMIIASSKAVSATAVSGIIVLGIIGNAMLAVAAAAISAINSVFIATGIALSSNPVTAPAGQEMIGGAILAESVAGLALAGAAAAFNVALGGAIVAATAAQFTPFAEGGIVTGPTFALIGEAGPEAVIPLNGRNLSNMDSRETVIDNRIYMDGRETAHVITRHLPRAMRMQGAPA